MHIYMHTQSIVNIDTHTHIHTQTYKHTRVCTLANAYHAYNYILQRRENAVVNKHHETFVNRSSQDMKTFPRDKRQTMPDKVSQVIGDLRACQSCVGCQSASARTCHGVSPESGAITLPRIRGVTIISRRQRTIPRERPNQSP